METLALANMEKGGWIEEGGGEAGQRGDGETCVKGQTPQRSKLKTCKTSHDTTKVKDQGGVFSLVSAAARPVSAMLLITVGLGITQMHLTIRKECRARIMGARNEIKQIS